MKRVIRGMVGADTVSVESDPLGNSPAIKPTPTVYLTAAETVCGERCSVRVMLDPVRADELGRALIDAASKARRTRRRGRS